MRLFSLISLSLLTLLCIFNKTNAAKILVFAFHDTGSHFVSMSQFFTRLANSGHQIHLFDTIFNKTKFHHTNIHHLHFTIPRDKYPPEFLWATFVNSRMMLSTFTYADKSVLVPLLESYQKEIDLLLSQKWDLILADTLFIPHGHAIALRLLREQSTPFVLYETGCEMVDWQMSMQAMGWNPTTKIYTYLEPPQQPSEHYKPEKFKDRLWTVVNTAYELFGFYYLKTANYYPNVERFGLDHFKYHQVLNSASLMFADRIDRMGWILPISNNLVDVGANCPKNAGELPKDLKEFIEKPGSKGLIYIAFGSYANWTAAPTNVIQSFYHLFTHLPSTYQIIFSYNGPLDKMPNVENLKLVDWAPQTAILRHSQMKLFVSHGGMKSAKESICAGVPILAMPLFAEQPYTADSIVKQQIGLVVNKLHVNGPQILEQVNELLKNPKYTQNVQKLRQTFTDRLSSSSMALAQWHIERLLRSKHSNFEWTKMKGAYLSWLEYMNFDVFAFVLIAFCFCL